MPAPVVVVGSPRSGTTLLADLLGCHPEWSAIYETPFVVDVAAEVLSGKPRRTVEANVRRIMDAWTAPLPHRPDNASPHERFVHGANHVLFEREQALAATETLLKTAHHDAWAIRALSRWATSLMDLHARRDGKPGWINKFPEYALCLGLIDQLFPGVRVVHAVRDGRDVALSILGKPMGAHTVDRVAQQWQKTVRAAMAWGEQHPDRYLEVRYEDVIAEPAVALHRLYAWMGSVDPDPTPALAAYEARGIAFLPERATRWPTALPEVEQDIFVEVAGSTLKAHGYPVGVPALAG